MNKYISTDVLKAIWQRLTSSKVMWASLGGAVITVVRVIFDADITDTVNRVIDAIWAILVVYLAANNPTTTDTF